MMKTFLLRLIRQTDGYQLIKVSLLVFAIVIVINANRVAEGLDQFAGLLRTIVGHIAILW